MKHTTTELLKFKRLQRQLHESTRGTVGLLELLWHGTAKNAPRGDIGRFSNEEIAILCDWEGDPDVLVNALIETGWVDPHSECRLLVHDWEHHAPNFVKGVVTRGDGFISTQGGLPRVANPGCPTQGDDPGLGTSRAPVLPNQTSIPNKKSTSYSPDDLSVAQELWHKLKEVNPKSKPPNIGIWANDVRLMVEIDKRTHDEVLELFDWSMRDPFWCTNILSPGKLRKQWDRLTLQRDRPLLRQNGSNKPRPSTYEENCRRAEEIAKRLKEEGRL